jgi:hypothetical protein
VLLEISARNNVAESVAPRQLHARWTSADKSISRDWRSNDVDTAIFGDNWTPNIRAYRWGNLVAVNICAELEPKFRLGGTPPEAALQRRSATVYEHKASEHKGR